MHARRAAAVSWHGLCYILHNFGLLRLGRDCRLVSRSSGVPDPPDRPVRVLFLNTRSALGADVAVHLSLITNFDPDRVAVHVATNANSVDVERTVAALRRSPHVRYQVCDLGNEVAGEPAGPIGKLKALRRNARVAATLWRLARYVRQNRIDVIHAGDRPRDALFSTIL